MRAGVRGITGIDTRALTRHLRARGVVMGTVTRDETVEQALARLQASRTTDCGIMSPKSPLPRRMTSIMSVMNQTVGDRPHIVVLDLGVKRSIMRNLARRGCDVTAVPHSTTAEDILALSRTASSCRPGPATPCSSTTS